MNSKIISYGYNKNQALIDNPFDLDKSFVRELTKMNTDIFSVASELVVAYAKFTGDSYDLPLNRLSQDDQNDLARLYLEYSDRDLSECLYGHDFSINNDFTCAVLSLLKDSSPRNRQKFADITCRNILDYFKDAIQDILDKCCEDHFLNMKDALGMHSWIDREHGDVIWKS